MPCQPRFIPHFLLPATAAAAAFAVLAPGALHAADGGASATSKLEWRSVGPYIGGRVIAIAGDADRPNLFYMGGVDGGVWRSTDNGLQWKNLTDGVLPGTSNSIGAIAVAQSNPDVIYAGTGESDIRGDMITGDGVFRSTDAGKTWQSAGLEATHTISALVVDPANPDLVYAASMGHVFVPDEHRGVFKTTEGGKTWTKTLFVDDRTGVISLVMDATHPDVLYAAAWQAQRTPWSLSSGGPGSGLYKTTDGGAHWTNITAHPGLPAGPLGRMGVSVVAAHPDIVYAIVQAKDGGVFRSTDAGGTWTRVNQEMKLRQRAFYYMSIFADPKDPDTAYVPEVDALWVTHDGGKVFTQLHTPHGDNHIVWINPDHTNTLLEGNDGGATVSVDGGRTWSTEHNQPTGQFYHVNLDDRFPYHIFGAQQDEGSFEGPSASGGGNIPLGAWQSVAFGESTFVVPEPGNPDVNFGSGYYSLFMRYDMKTGEDQDVSPWPNYQEGSASSELKNRFAWTHPILFSPANPKELLLASQFLYKSLDEGQTWKQISPDLTRNDRATEQPTGGPVDLDQSGAEIYPSLSAVAVSPVDNQVIWAGSDDGVVHVTKDGGAHWTPVRPAGLPERAEVSAIEPSHTAAGAAYLTSQRYMWDDFTPYVYETTDYGQHWTARTAGLPADEYVFVVRQDPTDPNLLFLGTKHTVYVSLDAGLQWQPLGLNLPHVQVRDLAINVRQGQVVAATHGRSFWVLDDLALLEQLTRMPASSSADTTAVYAPQVALLTHVYGASALPAEDAGKNPPFGATVFFRVPADYDGRTPVSLAFADAGGHLIRRFALHLRTKTDESSSEQDAELSPAGREARAKSRLTGTTPGMNRFQWDLRYPDATEVDGFYPPIAAGGLPDGVEGPVVVPGEYQVTLTYGSRTVSQSFSVKLDPRLTATPDALQARLDLELKIHQTLDTLDRTINDAVAARDRLASPGAPGGGALANLNTLIGDAVQLQITSSEGTLLHEAKLRSHLAYLAADIDLAYAAPTAAQQAVFNTLSAQASMLEQQVKAAIAAARNALAPRRP
ncbi:MAG: WD40/YVTN/BNR-like repeat-containing protein [Vicinamibacterales bacterium]